MKHSVEKVKLKNGAEGLLIDVPNASVMSFKIHFRGGMRYAKSPELFEIAHLVEHLSFGANAEFRDEQAYESEFTKNGAYHNAWTSDCSVCYEAECADFEWDRILKLKQVAITSPRFNEDEVITEKRTVRSELTGYMNDYARLLWPRLQKEIGEDVPNLKERIATLSNIELKDIREHYRRTHTAKNMRFIITGETHKRKREILKILNSWDLKEGTRFEIPHDDLHSAAPVVIRRKDASNLTFGFSFICPRRLSFEEIQTIGALNHILTGTMSSRIFGQARKKGLVYGIGSSINPSTHYTSWDFDGEVNEDSLDDLFALISKELKKILKGEISDDDINAAKSYARGRYQMGVQTVSQISDFYAENYFMADEINNYSSYLSIIQKINKPNIIKLAKEFLETDIHALVAVGSCEKSLVVNAAKKLEILEK